MAIVVSNTNYGGEVLEKILTMATTGNEIVSKGLMMVIPGVEKRISIPRIKTGKMLQKRKEMPGVSDAKGNITYSEHSLDPHDFMLFTTFNPRTFETIWRKWQPKGDLVFSQLPPDAQAALLEAVGKQAEFELGWMYINGVYGEGDNNLFNGIIHQAAQDSDVIVAETNETTMLGKLKALRKKIPASIVENPSLRIIMSVGDFQEYDDELTKRDYKNASELEVNEKRYKGIKIETLTQWPDGLIMCTLCAPDVTGNLFAAVNLQDDEHVIDVNKVSNAGELYYVKMLMKADTNIGFGEEVVVVDSREHPDFTVATPEPSASANDDNTGGTAEGEGSGE